MKNLLFVHGNSGTPVKLISVVFRQIYPYAGFQKDTCFANRNLPQSWQLLSVIIFGCLHVLLQFKVGTTCLRVLALPFVNSCLCHSEVYLVQCRSCFSCFGILARVNKVVRQLKAHPVNLCCIETRLIVLSVSLTPRMFGSVTAGLDYFTLAATCFSYCSAFR